MGIELGKLMLTSTPTIGHHHLSQLVVYGIPRTNDRDMPRSTRYRSSLALIVGAGLISLILWYASLQDESREHLNSSVWRTLWPCQQGSIGDSKWDCIDRDHASRSRVDVELQKQQLDDLVAERKIWTK
jgi:hypothetical protein